MESEIKKKLANGDVTVGSWMQICDASVAELMGRAGYDWVAVDLEHGDAQNRELANIFRALELGGTLPFARVPDTSSTHIKQCLDSGAKGLIFPMIESSKQLEEAISWALYPPLGKRGIGYCRANLFGKHFDTYLETADQIPIVAQIEDIKAVESLDAILTVKGLDAIMIGPYDLSGSMDLTGQLEHPEFNRVMDEIAAKALQHKIPMGLHIVQPDQESLLAKIDQGYQFIAYGIDTVFLYGSSENPVK